MKATWVVIATQPNGYEHDLSKWPTKRAALHAVENETPTAVVRKLGRDDCAISIRKTFFMSSERAAKLPHDAVLNGSVVIGGNEKVVLG